MQLTIAVLAQTRDLEALYPERETHRHQLAYFLYFCNGDSYVTLHVTT